MASSKSNAFRAASLIVGLATASAAAGAGEGRPKLPGIKGGDDRDLIRTSDYPWRAIGRVNVRSGGYCTGVMIAPTRVLTAAHCLWNKRTQAWFPARSLHFVAGYMQGGYVAHARVASFRKGPGFQYSRKLSRAQAANDWAVLTLRKDISATTGVIPVLPPKYRDAVLRGDRTPRLIQAGYSQDKQHMLTVHRGCSVIGRYTRYRLLLHDCDAVKGDSGSPVLVRRADGYGVLAIHVATNAAPGRATIGVAAMAFK